MEGTGVAETTGGVLLYGCWKEADAVGGGGVGRPSFAVARISSARLLELRKEGVADGSGN